MCKIVRKINQRIFTNVIFQLRVDFLFLILFQILTVRWLSKLPFLNPFPSKNLFQPFPCSLVKIVKILAYETKFKLSLLWEFLWERGAFLIYFLNNELLWRCSDIFIHVEQLVDDVWLLFKLNQSHKNIKLFCQH
jgi:hypothetical protein